MQKKNTFTSEVKQEIRDIFLPDEIQDFLKDFFYKNGSIGNPEKTYHLELLTDTIEEAEELIEKCREKNIGFIDMKPLAGGAIDDAKLALRFVAANPNVDVLIPGMAETREIEENFVAIEDNSPLTAEELEKIEAIRKSLGTQFCRRCNYCAPCTAGIPIPMVFLMEGYYSRYDLKEWAAGRYNAMAKTAADCVECGACEDRCPYNLPIRQMLKKAVAVFGK